MDDVVLADAVDHGGVAGLRFEARERGGERLLDVVLFLVDGDGVIAVVTLVKSTHLQTSQSSQICSEANFLLLTNSSILFVYSNPAPYTYTRSGIRARTFKTLQISQPHSQKRLYHD